MSTTEASTVQPVKSTRKYEFFDSNLVLQTREVEVEYTPVTTQEDAVKAINEIGDWITAANHVIRKKALADARAKAGVSGGINREVLMEFIKPYREMPQFASLISSSDKRKATAEEWNKQTEAILSQIRNVEFIMNAIKERSAAANTEED